MDILERILPRVTRPARYTGGEWNQIKKDWETTPVRLALAFPDLYEVGMSNLGLAILYDIANRLPFALAERAFAPWADMEAEMRQAGLPLFSLESRRPLAQFDLIGFSLGYELGYTNVLNMLDLAGLPLRAAGRDGSHPLVIAGGTCALNPEPLADFIDLFVLGDGEEALPQLLDVCRQGKEQGWSREDVLLRAAQIPGFYAPRFYEAQYHPDGTVARLRPLRDEATLPVRRRLVAELPPPLTRPIVPYLQTIHDRGAVEIQRGCTRGCRFCQAGMVYRPLRRRSPQEVLQAVEDLTASCGYEEISLLSLSSSDYPGIGELVSGLVRRYRERGLSFSLPSLRLDTFSVSLAASLLGRGKKKGGFTLAPEAGSEALRRAINKPLREEDFMATLAAAHAQGWSSFKLYLMVGLPGEKEEDLQATIAMVKRLRDLGGPGRPLNLKVSLTAFVPKPHTPFQWAAQNTPEALEAKLETLRRGLRKAGAQVSWTDPQVSLLEAVLSRGDRRLGQAIHRAWELGCAFDAWRERFDFSKWRQAFAEAGLDPAFYAHRERPTDEVLPWSHIEAGVSPAFLKREWERARECAETPDCREGPCALCGLQRWSAACKERAAAPTAPPASGAKPAP